MKRYRFSLVAAFGASLLMSAGTVQAGGHGAESMNKHHGKHGMYPHGGMRAHATGGAHSAGMLDAYDSDNDGVLTREEVLGAREAQLKAFDADQDGTLTIDEYEALWLDAMRERMVDRFQQHDDDGDGQVTVEEFNEEFQRFVERFGPSENAPSAADDQDG